MIDSTLDLLPACRCTPLRRTGCRSNLGPPVARPGISVPGLEPWPCRRAPALTSNAATDSCARTVYRDKARQHRLQRTSVCCAAAEPAEGSGTSSTSTDRFSFARQTRRPKGQRSPSVQPPLGPGNRRGVVRQPHLQSPCGPHQGSLSFKAFFFLAALTPRLFTLPAFSWWLPDADSR